MSRTLVTGVLALMMALGCKSKTSAETDPLVARVTLDEPEGHWAREGFVPMIPPVRLPSTSATLDDVTVWLALPEGGVIQTEVDDEGHVTLAFPPGTRSDRVESRGPAEARVVVDVRGTVIKAEGVQWMHTLRRAGKGRDTSLFGYSWPRDDADAHGRATERLLAELGQRPPGQAMSEAKRERYLASIERKNQCTHCHGYARPTNQREDEHGLVNRGTDASGFYTPQTVLADTIVLERYGRLDPNLDDPAITIRCPSGAQPTFVTRNDRRRAECPDRAVPIAQADLRALDPSRARAVCDARRYLHHHLDERGKELFRASVNLCDELFGSS